MTYCQCDICLLTRGTLNAELVSRGLEPREHRASVNQAAQKACEKARAEGYVDPPSPFPRGVPL